MSILYSPAALGPLKLQNHLVMAPMTRNRASGNVPNDLVVEYYRQRASAGLIVTEGTSPSPNGLGYPRIPGIFSEEQVEGWRKVAAAVHEGGAKIFVQLMHCGRIGHPLNLPAGARVLGPSAIAAAGEIYTDAEGMKPHPTPEPMTEADIQAGIAEFGKAAHNAVAAGCDGVELHAANGYLLEQFIRPTSNQRTDRYGGSIENRAGWVLMHAMAATTDSGEHMFEIRLTPYGPFKDIPAYAEMESDYAYLAARLNELGLAYVHLVDHSPMGAPPVPGSIKQTFRKVFHRTLILSGGYDSTRAEQDLQDKACDLIAVGRPFLANPDLVARWKAGAGLNDIDYNTFYTPGPQGFTDYPQL